VARTIHEIDISRQRVGACDVVGKVFVEEPVGSVHDPIHAAEAAMIARELEEAIAAVLASHPPASHEPAALAGALTESVLKPLNADVE
jgi:hypothetical protein